MKKTLLAVFFSLFISSIASAELGVNVGVSAQIGSMETSGKEASSDGTSQTSDVEEALFGTAGFFIEKDLSFLPGPFGRIAIGFDNIAHDIDLGTQSNHRAASLGASGATVSAGNNSLTAEVTSKAVVRLYCSILALLIPVIYILVPSGLNVIPVALDSSLLISKSAINVGSAKTFDNNKVIVIKKIKEYLIIFFKKNFIIKNT